MAGLDRSEVFPTTDTTGVQLPKVADGYVPSINNQGDVIIELANGNTQKIPLEVLIDSPDSVKLLPQITQNYINQIKDNLFVDGKMIEPKREMFEPGKAGDKAFKDFLGVYNIFFPDITDTFFEDVEKLEPTEKVELKDADITKLKKDEKKGDEILIEELPSAGTKAPLKKPDQPEKEKEETLESKIKKDFPNTNVGMSGEGGNLEIKGSDKKKTDTQTQTEDVFKGSGVEPMYQSASLASNDKFIKRIMDDEGEPFLEATKAFEDEKNFTIGYGRNNANIKKGDKITLEQAQKNLAEDVEIRLEEIQDLIPNFSKFSNELQLALFSEYFRGSVRQSPKTVKLINEGNFAQAAAEFLDNDEYRNAVDRGRKGIRKE